MASILNVVPATYYTYERGNATPRKGRLKLLSDFLGINYEELIEELSRWREFVAQSRRESALKKVQTKKS